MFLSNTPAEAGGWSAFVPTGHAFSKRSTSWAGNSASRCAHGRLPFAPAAVRRQRVNIVGCQAVSETSADRLRSAIAEHVGEERGIFGIQLDEEEAVHREIEKLEAQATDSSPTSDNAAIVAGSWKLLYTTLTILGRRRTMLAIGTKKKSGFVFIGELYQIVRPEASESINIVEFNLAIGGSGTFTTIADYTVESAQRVAVQSKSSSLEPKALEAILGDKSDLLTEIFDPTGHLDITFVGDDLRIGRDHNGDIFVLERCENPLD